MERPIKPCCGYSLPHLYTAISQNVALSYRKKHRGGEDQSLILMLNFLLSFSFISYLFFQKIPPNLISNFGCFIEIIENAHLLTKNSTFCFQRLAGMYVSHIYTKPMSQAMTIDYRHIFTQLELSFSILFQPLGDLSCESGGGSPWIIPISPQSHKLSRDSF